VQLAFPAKKKGIKFPRKKGFLITTRRLNTANFKAKNLIWPNAISFIILTLNYGV